MKNRHGVEFAEFYGNIHIASYPNYRVLPKNASRRKRLMYTKPSAEIHEGLKFPGGRRPGRVADMASNI